MVGKNINLCHGAVGVVREMDYFTFEATETIFGCGVFIGIAPMGHALNHSVGLNRFLVGHDCNLDFMFLQKISSLGSLQWQYIMSKP